MNDSVVLLQRHKLDVDDYYRMAEAGILGREDRVELIDGEVIDMAPIGQAHEAVVNRLTRALVLAFGDRAIVSVQNSVRLNRRNAPQPDFAVLRPRADFYAEGDRPGPAEILVLIEVADSSLRFDRVVKQPLYARAGVAELWIIDLQHRTLEAYQAPRGETYAEARTHHPGDTVTLALAPDVKLAVTQIFG